jgi:hypothetical protein
VPKDFRDAAFAHLCPFDFTSQSQMTSLFKSGSDRTVCLDPAPSYMKPALWRELRIVLQGLTAFLPSEEEIRALFWGETNDLWEMARRISEYGPRIIVIKRGALGAVCFSADTNRRFEIPAYPSRLADPTGAGDAFCGGFLAGMQKTNDPFDAAVLHGNVSASLKVEGTGPFYPLDVMPGLAEARFTLYRKWQGRCKMDACFTACSTSQCKFSKFPRRRSTKVRAASLCANRFIEENLKDVSMDSLGNVYARLPGKGKKARALVVSAHLDTVFPPSISLEIKKEAGRIVAPGIGDNSLGVAALFGILWSLRERKSN